MMMTAEGALDYCYNSQIAVSEEGIVVGNAVANTVQRSRPVGADARGSPAQHGRASQGRGSQITATLVKTTSCACGSADNAPSLRPVVKARSLPDGLAVRRVNTCTDSCACPGLERSTVTARPKASDRLPRSKRACASVASASAVERRSRESGTWCAPRSTSRASAASSGPSNAPDRLLFEASGDPSRRLSPGQPVNGCYSPRGE